jgi:hypothetical protein
MPSFLKRNSGVPLRNWFQKHYYKKCFRKWAKSNRPFPPPEIIRYLLEEERIGEYKTWLNAGKPLPPPHIVKQEILKYYAEKFKPHILIETGTFMGEMIDACAKLFDQIYSVELSTELSLEAAKRFAEQSHISIIQGDSVEILPEILLNINEPCLFWLDGHYSGGFTAKGNKETPILQEVISILNHHIDRHIILIDDARCFNGQRIKRYDFV